MYLMPTMIVGLFAAILMFCGDMLLYFTPADYEVNGTHAPYINIMKKLPNWRLKLGGVIGPIAAFFYCIGYLHLLLITSEGMQWLAIWATALVCLGIIVGGAYHSHFTYYGLMGKLEESEAALSKITNNIALLHRISMLPIAVGCLIIAGLVVSGQTIYPWWFVFFTPAITLFFQFLWGKLRQPFRVVVFGGWSNLMFVIYYAAALLLITKRFQR